MRIVQTSLGQPSPLCNGVRADFPRRRIRPVSTSLAVVPHACRCKEQAGWRLRRLVIVHACSCEGHAGWRLAWVHRNMACRSQKPWRRPAVEVRSPCSTRQSSGGSPLATTASPSRDARYLRPQQRDAPFSEGTFHFRKGRSFFKRGVPLLRR